MNTQPTSTSFASFTAPTISAVSIASASMMVELSISTWAARKLDKRASEDITAQNYAAKGVANVNKKLLGECAELDAVHKFASNARILAQCRGQTQVCACYRPRSISNTISR